MLQVVKYPVHLIHIPNEGFDSLELVHANWHGPVIENNGLNLDKAVELFRHFRGRINTSFGIGTKLTCDLPGVSPMNIVFKLMECNGGPVAKISDSPGKTLCRDADFIRNLKQAFHVGV